MNYLTQEQLTTNLKLGESIEQWLQPYKNEDYTVLKWLRIDQENSKKYSVCYFECFDEGNQDFLDIYEFSLLDPDNPYGLIHTFDSIQETLDFAIDTYNVSIDKFVSAGMIQEIYRDYLNE